MQSKLQLRSFLASDLDRILEIEGSSFTIDVYSKTKFENLYKRHSNDFIVAELQGEIIGYIIAYDSGGFGDFDSVAVEPKFRHRGVGSLLVNFMLERFKKNGLKKASLEVRTANKTAIAFFGNLGFNIRGIIKGFYRDSGDAYIMEIEI